VDPKWSLMLPFPNKMFASLKKFFVSGPQEDLFCRKQGNAYDIQGSLSSPDV